MDKGTDFLRAQINNAVAQHHNFLSSLESHAKDARDERFRALCLRHIAAMKSHHALLEAYQRGIDAGPGAVKKALGAVAETAKEWTDAMRNDDYLRLVSDIVLARQAEDTFKTFREGGRILGDEALRRLGEIGEQDHDVFVQEANRLVQSMFVEHVRVPAAAGA
jgi:hypothetical protein